MTALWIVQPFESMTLVGTAGPGTPEPANWPRALADAALRHGSGAVAVCKRVTTAGQLVAMGELLVHPKGLHSLGHGLTASAHRFPEEVDGAMGGVAAFPTELIAGLPEPRGAFGLMHWCLEARLRGGRIVAVPDVTWAAGDAPMPIAREDLAAFIARFGFHPLAPDIDAIAATAELGPLRWNVRFFGSEQPFDKYSERGAFHWKAFAEHEPFRTRAEFLVRMAQQSLAAGEGPALDVGCGDGLYAQLLAAAGVPVIGIDDDAIGIAEANDMVKERTPRAQFERGSAYRLRFEAGEARGAILFDVIEHLHNPARAVRELARVIAPGGALLLSTPEWQFGHMSDPVYHAHEFTLPELQRLLAAEGLFSIERTARIGGIYRDLVVLARRSAAPPPTAPAR